MNKAAIQNRLDKADKALLPTWGQMVPTMAAIAGPMTKEQRTAVLRLNDNPEDAAGLAAYEAWYVPHIDKIMAAWDRKFPRWREAAKLWERGIDT